MTVRKAKVDNNTWTRFISRVHGGRSTEICGLCANRGILRMSGLTTPSGFTITPVEGYCICPNGRALLYVAERTQRDIDTPTESP
jgi:hypothetical protein